jgi:hypothetical protein
MDFEICPLNQEIFMKKINEREMESWYLVGRILNAFGGSMPILHLHATFALIQRKWLDKYGYVSRPDEQFFFCVDFICIKSIVTAIEDQKNDIFNEMFIIDGDSISLKDNQAELLFNYDDSDLFAVAGYTCEAQIDCLALWLPEIVLMSEENILAHTLGLWDPKTLDCYISWEDYVQASSIKEETKAFIIEHSLKFSQGMDKMFSTPISTKRNAMDLEHA